jgi:hypothetical protein
MEGLRKDIPEAFKSISSATINRYYKHCCKIINAYNSGLKYGTEEFTQQVYTSHRQVTDKSKWLVKILFLQKYNRELYIIIVYACILF